MSHEDEGQYPQQIWDGLTPNRTRLDDKRPVNSEDWNTLVAEMRGTQNVVTTIAGLASANWLDSVKSRFDPDPSLPAAPLDGDRYLSLGTLNGWIIDNIYEFSIASGLWNETIPIEGSAIHVDDENKIYMFQDGVWKKIGQTISHGSLLDLGNDDHLQYMHKDIARTVSAVHTYNPAAPGAPFVLGGNAIDQKVIGLNADKLDGLDSTAFEVANAVSDHETAFDHTEIHLKDKDGFLDFGGANQVSAVDLKAHLTSSSNPHSVTKAQVGLSNVADALQLQVSNNLSDLASAPTALTNLGAAAVSHKDAHKSGGADAFTATDLLEAVVKRLQVSGPVILSVGAVADGEFLKRVGTTLIGASAGGNITLFSATVGLGGTYADVPAFIIAADASGATRYELHLVDNTVAITGDVVFKHSTDWYGVGNDSPSEKTVLSLFSGRILLNQAGVPPTSLHRFYNLNILKTGTLGQITIQDEQGQVEFHNSHLSAQSPVTAIPMVLFDAVTQEFENRPSIKLFNCGFKTSANSKYLFGTSAAGNGHDVRIEVHNCYPLQGGASTSILMSLKGTTTAPLCSLFMTGGSRFFSLAFEGQVSPAPTLLAHVDSISVLDENKMSLDLGGSFIVSQYGGDRIRETSGPTQLAIADIADGEFFKRSGTTVVGDVPAGTYSHPNHSGDVTSVGDGAQTIGANKVTNGMLAQIATKRIKGRSTAGTGDLEDLSGVAARGIIGMPTKYADGGKIIFNTVSLVDIAPGRWRDSTDVFDIISAGTLTANIALAGAGSKANGLDADPATEAADTWYAVHVIADTTGSNPVASLLSASAIAPTLPSGYDVFRRVGWIRNGSVANPGSDFVSFTQTIFGRLRITAWQGGINEMQVLAGGTAAAFADVDCSVAVPPTSELARFSTVWETGAAGSAGDQAKLRANGTTGDQANRIRIGVVSGTSTRAQVEQELDASQLVEYEVTDAANNSFGLRVLAYTEEV